MEWIWIKNRSLSSSEGDLSEIWKMSLVRRLFVCCDRLSVGPSVSRRKNSKDPPWFVEHTHLKTSTPSSIDIYLPYLKYFLYLSTDSSIHLSYYALNNNVNRAGSKRGQGRGCVGADYHPSARSGEFQRSESLLLAVRSGTMIDWLIDWLIFWLVDCFCTVPFFVWNLSAITIISLYWITSWSQTLESSRVWVGVGWMELKVENQVGHWRIQTVPSGTVPSLTFTMITTSA